MPLLPGQVLVKSALVDRPEYATAIGMITIELANLEIELGGLLGALLHVDPHYGRLVFLTPQSYAARLGILENVAQAALEGGPPGRAALDSIIARAKAYISRRNDLVHNAWGTSLDNAGQIHRQPLPIKETNPSKPVLIEELNDLLQKIQALISDVISTAEQMYRAWPPYTWQEKPHEPHAADHSQASPLQATRPENEPQGR